MSRSRVAIRSLYAAGLVGAVAGLSVTGLVAVPAGAAPSGSAPKHHHGTHHGTSHRPNPIPVVEHGTTLKTQPVVRADKAKPPAKVLTRNLVAGTGTAATATSTVSVKYVGANYKTGKDFTQATWQAGQATSFTLHGVVAGFAAGLIGMKVGGRREIVIPPKYGYGTTANGPIKKHETLVFVVDLEGVS